MKLTRLVPNKGHFYFFFSPGPHPSFRAHLLQEADPGLSVDPGFIISFCGSEPAPVGTKASRLWGRFLSPADASGCGSDRRGLTEVQGQVNGVGVLDPRQHGLALPPGGVLLVVVVGQVHGAVVVPGIPGIADVAGLSDPGGSGLDAVLLRRRAAGVGRHNGHIEGGVDELWHAALRVATIVRTFIHGSPDTEQQQQPRPGHRSPDQCRHLVPPRQPPRGLKKCATLPKTFLKPPPKLQSPLLSR